MIDLEDLRRKAEAATPGEWQSLETQIAYLTGKSHPTFGIYTTWVHPQSKDFFPIVSPCVRYIEGETAGLHVLSEDAAFIAAANPATILALIAEIDRCHARLEIDHVYRVVDGKTVREDVPYAERSNVPDGIECRDATIGLLEDRITELEAKGKSNVHLRNTVWTDQGKQSLRLLKLRTRRN